MRARRIVVVGAGIGGLVAALSLAGEGLDVIVVEAAEGPGGKMRATRVGDVDLDQRVVKLAAFQLAAEHLAGLLAGILAG